LIFSLALSQLSYRGYIFVWFRFYLKKYFFYKIKSKVNFEESPAYGFPSIIL
jgi:hypothetical protein